MRSRTLAVAVSLMTLAPLACDRPKPGAHIPPAPGELIQSDQDRDLNPSVDPTDLQALVTGNNNFAFDLYRTVIADKDGNLFYSPHSITMAIAMAWGGARSTTESEMQAGMHYTLGQDGTHPAMNALDLALATRGQGAHGADGREFRLNVLNATWGQKDYPFSDKYLDLLAVNYGAGVHTLDFETEPEPSRVQINDWVAEATEDRIEDLIPEGAITPLTRLVLTNAIYFNAGWKDPFSVDATAPGTFHRADGSTSTVDMMTNDATYGYASESGVEVVEMPYDGEELSMVLLVPDAGTFEDFEASLSGDQVAGWLGDLQYGEILLTLPKFKYSTELPLKRTLIEMNMPTPFDEIAADFSGINNGFEQLYISDVLHQAFISVNEYGTEAAAATAVIVGTTSLPPVVTVDRPFVYLVRDNETGAILFVGRVVDPA